MTQWSDLIRVVIVKTWGNIPRLGQVRVGHGLRKCRLWLCHRHLHSTPDQDLNVFGWWSGWSCHGWPQHWRNSVLFGAHVASITTSFSVTLLCPCLLFRVEFTLVSSSHHWVYHVVRSPDLWLNVMSFHLSIHPSFPCHTKVNRVFTTRLDVGGWHSPRHLSWRPLGSTSPNNVFT